MYARDYHNTPIGARVMASIGTSEHIAKVIDKDDHKRKFLLRFNLASGDARKEWRMALRCQRVEQTQPMGPTRRVEQKSKAIRDSVREFVCK